MKNIILILFLSAAASFGAVGDVILQTVSGTNAATETVVSKTASTLLGWNASGTLTAIPVFNGTANAILKSAPAGGGNGELWLWDLANSNWVKLVAGDLSWNFGATDVMASTFYGAFRGDGGQITSLNVGALGLATVSSTGQVLFNASNLIDGDAEFTYNSTTNTLTAGLVRLGNDGNGSGKIEMWDAANADFGTLVLTDDQWTFSEPIVNTQALTADNYINTPTLYAHDIQLLDTDNTHRMRIEAQDNLTAERYLYIGLDIGSGSGNRVLDMGGNLTVGTDGANVTGFNSGNVTLTGTPDYITINGQTITRGLIDLATDVTGKVLIANLGTSGTPSSATYLRGDNTWATPAGGGGIDPLVTISSTGGYGRIGLWDAGNSAFNYLKAYNGGFEFGSGLTVKASSFEGEGYDITNLNASNINDGILAAARLPAPTTTTIGGVMRNTGTAGQYVTGISTSGALQYGTPAGGGGSIGGTLGTTDNAIPRADGIGGSTLKSSLVTIADDGTLSKAETYELGQNTSGYGRIGLWDSDNTEWVYFQAGQSRIIFPDIVASSFTGSGSSITGINASNISSGTLGVPHGGTGLASAGTAGNVLTSTGTGWVSAPSLGSNLTDPNADRIVFWDDSAGQVAWLTAGSGLTITGTAISASGAGVTDGDKGDITVTSTGATWTIDNQAVTYAKMQHISSNHLVGRHAGSTGSMQQVSVGNGLEFQGSGIRRSALTGDVTASAGSNSTTLSNTGVTAGTYTSITSITVDAKGRITDLIGTLVSTGSSVTKTLYRMPVSGDRITITPPTGPALLMQVINSGNSEVADVGYYPLNLNQAYLSDLEAWATDLAGSINWVNGENVANFDIEATATSSGDSFTVTGVSTGTLLITTNGNLFTPP
jgi:hypothetical protein